LPCAAAILALASIGTARAAASPETLLDWGLEAQARTVDTLQVPGSSLYAETASLNGQRSGGNRGFAYIWPLSTQFRVQNSLTRIDPAVYRPILERGSPAALEGVRGSPGAWMVPERVEQSTPHKAPGAWRTPKPGGQPLPFDQLESRDGFWSMALLWIGAEMGCVRSVNSEPGCRDRFHLQTR
jgi:hypothetical protein